MNLKQGYERGHKQTTKKRVKGLQDWYQKKGSTIVRCGEGWALLEADLQCNQSPCPARKDIQRRGFIRLYPCTVTRERRMGQQVWYCLQGTYKWSAPHTRPPRTGGRVQQLGSCLVTQRPEKRVSRPGIACREPTEDQLPIPGHPRREQGSAD